MCRFILYLGPPVRLATVVTEPSHSLIQQSAHSTERAGPVNGDGFGLGWYALDVDPEPAVFRSTTPAWSNENLRDLCRVVASPCLMAHVRAATDTSPPSEVNCHPFRHRRLLFMHNGEVGGFHRIRRRLLALLSDEAFEAIRGSTDSEHVFALFLDHLRDQASPDPGSRMASALNRTVWTVRRLVREAGVEASSCLNLAVADGEVAAACRIAWPEERRPESLHLMARELYQPHVADTEQRRAREGGPSAVIASERLTDDPGWVDVQPGELVCLRHDRGPALWRLRPEGLTAAEEVHA